VIPWLIGCAALIIGGTLIACNAPQFAALSLFVVALASVAALQVILLGIASFFVNPRTPTSLDTASEYASSDFSRMLWAYRDIRMFLARLTGIVGLLYGVATRSVYFTVLGAAATILFWTLDRLQAARIERAQHETDTTGL
jgi:hypothetical protein